MSPRRGADGVSPRGRRLAGAIPATCLVLSWVLPWPAAAQSFEAPQQDYILNCQGCHLADGGGAPGLVPRLADHVGWFLHVPGGREYLAQVPGVANAPLGDAELAAVLNWMLQTFSAGQLPADFRPYDAVEVSRLRREPAIDVTARRAGLVDQIRRDVGVTDAVETATP